MSEPARTSRTKQEYEQTLDASDKAVAQFEHKSRNFLDATQHLWGNLRLRLACPPRLRS